MQSTIMIFSACLDYRRFLNVSNSSTFSAKVDRYKENNYLEVNQIHEFAEGSVSCLPEQPNTTGIQNTVDKIRMKNLPLHVYMGILLSPTKGVHT